MMKPAHPASAPIVFDTRPCRSLLMVYALAALIVLGLGARADAAPAQQYWLVSTRNAAHCSDCRDPIESLCYWRLNDNGCWTNAGAEAFFATDDVSVPTVVFLHGNRTIADEVDMKARYAYDRIQCQAPDRPFRYVVWSWPADRVLRHNDDDVRLKAAYCNDESHYLAQWLNRLRPGVKVSLVGHSFGPRIIAGALHLLGGGEVAGQGLPPETVADWADGKRNPVRAVLLAAAIDSDSFAACGRRSQALPLVDRALITCNGCDRVLRWYARFYGSQSMGAVGPCGVANPEKVEIVDVSCEVGKLHDWRYYCSASGVCSQWPHYTFLDDTVPE